MLIFGSRRDGGKSHKNIRQWIGKAPFWRGMRHWIRGNTFGTAPGQTEEIALRVSAKVLPDSIRMSVTPEFNRPRKTRTKRAGPVDEAVEKERFAQSIARAKQTIEDIALCNYWDWFATFTFAPDCPELAECDNDYAKLCVNFLKGIRTKYKAKEMKWLLILEPPETMCGEELPLHVHGLIAGAPPEAIHEWKLNEKGCPFAAKLRLMDGKKAAEFPEYSKRYGYNFLETIVNLKTLLRYLLKSLDKAQQYRKKGQHLYYVSRNVKRPRKFKAVPCTDAMYEKIEELSKSSYQHKAKDKKVVYGKTFILPDSTEADILLYDIFADIEY